MNLYGVVLSGRKVTGLGCSFKGFTFGNPNVRIVLLTFGRAPN